MSFVPAIQIDVKKERIQAVTGCLCAGSSRTGRGIHHVLNTLIELTTTKGKLELGTRSAVVLRKSANMFLLVGSQDIRDRILHPCTLA